MYDFKCIFLDGVADIINKVPYEAPSNMDENLLMHLIAWTINIVSGE
jgi:hypothetical protein